MKERLSAKVRAVACIVGFLCAGVAPAQADEDTAKQLQNPVANLISFPIQSNFDFNIGPDDGWRVTNNVQPVIPFSISKDWNLISRTIVPVVYQNDVLPGKVQFGLSDTLQSLFLSPAAPLETPVGNFIWGVGPAIAIPTSTSRYLGSGTFGMGPTGVGLFQEGPWTYGALVNHVWGVTKTRDDVPDLNSTFLQPFIAYTTSDAWTVSVNTEFTYDWTAEKLSGPVNFGLSKLIDIGGQPVSLQGRVRWWAADTETSPQDLGFTLNVTFVFPQGK